MRNIWCLVLLACAFILPAQTPEEFFSLVDFDASVVSISKLVEEDQTDQIDTERFFLLEGAVGSVQLLNPSPDRKSVV